MDPSLLIPALLVPGVKKLLSLLYSAAKSHRRTVSMRKELECFCAQLWDILLHWGVYKSLSASAGFNPKALEELKGNMEAFVRTAEDLLERPHLKKEDVQKFRDNVLTTFQFGMTSALLEIVGEIVVRVDKLTMNLAVQMEVLALAYPAELQKVLHHVSNMPHQTMAFKDNLKEVKTMAFKDNLKEVLPLSNVVPDILAAMSTSETDLSHYRSEEKVVKRDEAKFVERSQSRNSDTLLTAARQREQEFEDNMANNPNRLMSFDGESCTVFGDGELHWSKRRHDCRIEVSTSGGPEKKVRAIMGTRPMKISAKLSYFYYEVEVIEMAELGEKGKTCTHSGVGVGLAMGKKFRDDKMVGWYQNSFGYDGRMGEVYCSMVVPHAPFNIGILRQGDTLGIGLIDLGPKQRPAIFFVKNGEVQRCCTQESLDHGLELHPVIALASEYAKVCVNFHGPFNLPSSSKLAAMLNLIP